MTQEEIVKKLEDLDKKVNEKKKRDGWDKIQVLIPLLIPATIAIVGWNFTSEQNKIQQKIAKDKDSAALEVSKQNSLMSQMDMVYKMVKDFDTKTPKDKAVVTQLLVDATPNIGPKILPLLESQNVQDKVLVKQIKAVQENKTNELADNLFSTDRKFRYDAYDQLTLVWNNDTATANKLIDKAKTATAYNDAAQQDGLYNTVATLKQFNVDVLKNFAPDLKTLQAKIPSDRTNTIAQMNEIMDKINEKK